MIDNNELIIVEEIKGIESDAGALTVIDATTEKSAAEFDKACKNLIDQINYYWKEPIENANKAHKTLTGKRNDQLDPVKKARQIASGKLSDYRKALRIAEDEKNRKLEDERKKREAAEAQRLFDEAEKLEKSGKLEESEETLQKIEDVKEEKIVVESELKKSTKTDFSTLTYSFDLSVSVVDEMEVIKAVLDGDLSLDCIEIKVNSAKKELVSKGMKKYMQDNKIYDLTKKGLKLELSEKPINR